MSELPTGTVSLVFSDIEGSMVLLSRLGAAYVAALDGQRLVLRKAWKDHGGMELGTEGDSFFVVFTTAEAAVKAATQAQQELAAFEWPGGSRCGSGWASTPAALPCMTVRMWGWTCTEPRGSPEPRTAGR